MLMNNSIDIKLFYRSIEFISKMLGSTLPHERFKLLALDQFKAESKEEYNVKYFSDAYHFILNNVTQNLTKEIIEKSYYLLTNQKLDKLASNSILNKYYQNYDETSHYLATLIHFVVINNVEYESIKFAFIMSNYVMIKKGRFPLIPYEYFFEKYMSLIKTKKGINDLTLLFMDMEQISKPLNRTANLSLDEVIEFIKLNKTKIITQFKIKKLYLYGSYVKEKTTQASDIDFLVIFKGQLINFEKNQLTNQLKDFLTIELNKNADVLDFSHVLENLDINEMENIITLI